MLIPTRVNNILDLDLNDDFVVSGLTVALGPPFSTSDHNSVSLSLVFLPPITHPSDFPKYKLNYDNLKLICNDLNQLNWSIFDNDDLDAVWTSFSDIIFNSVKKYGDIIPPGPSRPRISYPHAINKLLYRKRQLWKALRTFKTNALKIKYSDCVDSHAAGIENNIVQSNKIGKLYNVQIRNYLVSQVLM